MIVIFAPSGFDPSRRNEVVMAQEWLRVINTAPTARQVQSACKETGVIFEIAYLRDTGAAFCAVEVLCDGPMSGWYEGFDLTTERPVTLRFNHEGLELQFGEYSSSKRTASRRRVFSEYARSETEPQPSPVTVDESVPEPSFKYRFAWVVARTALGYQLYLWFVVMMQLLRISTALAYSLPDIVIVFCAGVMSWPYGVRHWTLKLRLRRRSKRIFLMAAAMSLPALVFTVLGF
jgi:hypothetical protein